MAKLLALTSRLPYPPREGHQLRSWHLLRALAARHEVTLLSFVRNDDRPEESSPLRLLVARLECFPILAEQSRAALGYSLAKGLCGTRPFVAEKYASLRMRARVTELARDADVVHVDMLPLMGLVTGVNGPPIVLNAHNVEHDLLRQRAAIESRWPQRLFLRSQLDKLTVFERDACRRAARVLACSSEDAADLARLAPHTPISVVPNGVDVERMQPRATPTPHTARLVFVGQLGWFPNRDGVQWFLDEVFPRVLAERPDAEFVVVGKSSGMRVDPRIAANVRLLGFADDIAPAIRDAAVYVVPLRTGSGTRLKVLEAMAFAKPLVSTHIGAQGIGLEHGSDVLFADSAEDFATAVLDLIADPPRAARLGAAARRKAEQHYDWKAIGRNLLGVYEEVLESQSPARVARQR